MQAYRSSRPEVFCKKGILADFAKFTGKHLCQSLFFNNVAGLAILDKRLFADVSESVDNRVSVCIFLEIP